MALRATLNFSVKVALNATYRVFLNFAKKLRLIIDPLQK